MQSVEWDQLNQYIAKEVEPSLLLLEPDVT